MNSAVEKKLGADKVESTNHDSGSENVDGKTGTAEDRADMFRMGKVQELRVCRYCTKVPILRKSLNCTAKLPFPVYMGLLYGLGCILGMLAGVSKEKSSVERWTCCSILLMTDICCATYRVASISLVNGGTAGYIWIFFISWMGFMLVNISMAEMASM